MLTVDEITAEVENSRRKSTVASIRSTESAGVVSNIGREADVVSIANADEDATLNEEDENYEIIDGKEEELEGDEEDDEDDDEDDDDDTLDDEEDEEDEEETLADADDDAPVKATGGMFILFLTYY